MGEKIVIAAYVDFDEPLNCESEQNQDSLPRIQVGNPTTDTLPKQVIALDVQPFEAFTIEALQNLDSLTNNNFSLVIVNDIENTSNNQNETFMQRNIQAINIFVILCFVAVLVFF